MNPRLAKALPVAAVLLLLAFLAGAGAMAAGPYIRAAAIVQDIDANLVLLASLRQQAARKPAVQKEYEALANPERRTHLLLDGVTHAVAGANLQKHLVELVRQHKGEMASVQVISPARDGDLTRISLGMSINVDIRGLRDVLFAIETGKPLLFVDDMEIKPSRRFTPGRPVALGEMLDVRLEISGFVANREGG